MSKLEFSPLANADLHELLDFIALDKPLAAVSFVRRIRETCELLSANPMMGELRSDLGIPAVRSFSVGKYVILFRPTVGGIEVARVVNGFRDVRQLTIG